MSNKYFVNFIEEGIQDLKYSDYTGGRIEVSKGSGYPIEEIRFFTKITQDWIDFVDKWDFEYLSAKKLQWLRDTIKEKYREE